MEAVDDVLQALLAALSGKASIEQNHVLEEFAKYVQGGGGLYVAQFGSEKLKEFEQATKENGLVYYAVTDVRNGKASAIIKDGDVPVFERTGPLLFRESRCTT